MPKKADGIGIVKVLLAEDLPSDAELEMRELKAGLGECAFRVVETRGAFIKTLKEFQPDLIVSDYKMPSFDGLSALRLAREHNPNIPFIIATGSMNEDTAVECMKAGADDYVIKEHLKRLSSAAINALKQATVRREKNRMQAALLESEDKFKYVFENSVIGKSLTKPNGEMQVNKSFCDMLGYSAAEMQGIKWQDITHPDDLDASQKMVDDLLSGKIKALRLEKRYFKKDGSIVWVDVGATLRRDNDGNPQYFMTSLSNITDRVEARQALQHSERQFRSIFEVASLGIVQVDPADFKFIKCNETYCRMLGYTMAEITKLHFPEISHPEDRAKDMELYKKTLRGEINGYQLEKRIIRKDGSIIWVNLNVAMARDEQGNILSSVSVVEDITQRKADQEELLKLKRAVEQSLSLIVITDFEGRIEYVNQRFTDVTGYSSDEAYGKNPNILKSGETSAEEYQVLWKTIISGKDWHGEFHNRKKNGELYWEKSIISPVRNTKGEITHFIDIKEDITEHKQAVQLLLESETRYQDLLQMAPVGIAVHSKGRVVFTNIAGARMLGCDTQDQLIGKSIADIVHPDGLAKAKDRIGRMMAGEKGLYPTEDVYRKLDGTNIDVEVTAAPLLYQGEPAVQVIVSDITERKRVEKLALLDEARLHSLLQITQSEFNTVPELLNLTLEIAIKLTASKFGFIRLYSEETQQFTVTVVSHQMLPNVPGENFQMPMGLDKLSFLSEPIHQRHAVVVNEENILKNRMPSGHIPISRFLSVPILDGKKIIAVIGMANKSQAYDDGDARQLTLLMDAVWKMVQRRKAEEELRESESKFRSVIETSADAIILTDPNGIVIEWNPAAERLLRTPRQAALGQPLWDVQFNAYADTSDTPDAYERLKKSILDVRKTGKAPQLNQLREQELRFKDGSVITIESIAFVFDKSAEGWHVGSITRDVSERKKKEEEVRQSETKFRTLFTNMVSGACVDEVIYKDGKMVDFRILDINPAYERILGVKREKVVGALASVVYANQPIPFLDRYAQVVESGKAQEFEAFFPPTGQYVHIAISSPAPGRFSTVFSDITERRQAAEALQQKIVELERFHDVTVDRELRMMELKREINALLKAAGQNEKFKGVN